MGLIDSHQVVPVSYKDGSYALQACRKLGLSHGRDLLIELVLGLTNSYHSSSLA